MNKRSVRDQKRWDTIYERLVAYKKEHKKTSVPPKYKEDPPLGRWVRKQRESYRNKRLSNVRINRLNSISFVWDPCAAYWKKMYERLVVYEKQNNNTCVPDLYTADPQLSIWVHNQRKSYNTNSSQLTKERKHKLNSINFVWDVLAAQWTEQYERLVAYKEHNNSTCVPHSYPADPQLAIWVGTQRIGYNKLTAERKDKLNSIGFVWAVQDALWTERYEQLVDYQKEHKATYGLRSYNPQLANWVSKQRLNYKTNSSRLTADRIKQLNKIGFVWKLK